MEVEHLVVSVCKKILFLSENVHEEPDFNMALLRSLTATLGTRCYRHGAPKGAFSRSPVSGIYSTENSEEPFSKTGGLFPPESRIV
jgi:hypothetical protein